jgi:hypothetical protein
MNSSPGREGSKAASARSAGYGTTNPVMKNDRSRSREGRVDEATLAVKDKKKGTLSLWKMMALTVSMGGSQVGVSMLMK